MKYICLLLFGVNVSAWAMENPLLLFIGLERTLEKYIQGQPLSDVKKTHNAPVNANGTTGSDLQRGAQYVAVPIKYDKTETGEPSHGQRRLGRGCDPNDLVEAPEVGPEKQFRAMLARLKADQEKPDTKITSESKPNQERFGRGCDQKAKL
ncbi:MAG TPA: hypothetical protein VKR54_03470 [Candidatus Babeliales bacterium]|jgi:hypothetical protein|nr:hypothetical protein [Candidatus Babeliales bacterium]